MDATNEFYNFLIKAGVPASIAISIGLAIKSKTQKLTVKRVFISYVTGVGMAWFIYPFVTTNNFGDYAGAIIGVIAITSEKIMEFILYRFNVDTFLGALVDAFKNFLVNLINGKK